MPTTAGAIDRIGRLCASGLEAKPLREGALDVIRAMVPFDAHLWVLTDPLTRVGTSPLADVPFLPWPRLPELIRSRYLTEVNRWDRLEASGDTTATLLRATNGDRRRSLIWREVLADYGVTDIVTVVFADRFGCWAFLDLIRVEGAEPFSDLDAEFLASIRGSLTTALRECQARTFVEVGEQIDLDGPAVVLLDEALRMHDQTSAAALTLLRLNPPGVDIAPVPAAVYNVGASLLALEQGIPVGAPRSRVHLGSGRWLTLRADRLGTGLAVTLESSTPLDRLEVFGLAHGLSPRERQVLGAMVAGADNRTMARALDVSDHTVHDHVKSVLAKCSVPSRQVLLARVVGTH